MTDALIPIVEIKINKEVSRERSLRFLLENGKQSETKQLLKNSSMNHLNRIMQVS